MFWGLIIEPNKKYMQVVDKSFHLSMASLDISEPTSNEPVQVMVNYEDSTYLLCTLDKKSCCQCPLDLNFAQGSSITFLCNGNSYVHLTGYIVEEDLDLDDESDDDEENDSVIHDFMQMGKRKAIDVNQAENGKKTAKRIKVEPESVEDSEDDSEDDELVSGGESVDDEEGESVEEEEEDDSDSSEEEPPKLVEKPKKQKAQEKPKNQQEKQKLVNGKAASAPQEKKKEKKQKGQQEESNEQQKKGKQKQQNNQVQKRVIEGGIQVEELKVGNGEIVKAGKHVTVYYIGKLSNGKKFDAMQQGAGFKFCLGKGEVIKGWDLGIAGMKVGGKRRLMVPARLAYGKKGYPPQIPPNSALTFEVEVKNVH